MEVDGASDAPWHVTLSPTQSETARRDHKFARTDVFPLLYSEERSPICWNPAMFAARCGTVQNCGSLIPLQDVAVTWRTPSVPFQVGWCTGRWLSVPTSAIQIVNRYSSFVELIRNACRGITRPTDAALITCHGKRRQPDCVVAFPLPFTVRIGKLVLYVRTRPGSKIRVFDSVGTANNFKQARAAATAR